MILKTDSGEELIVIMVDLPRVDDYLCLGNRAFQVKEVCHQLDELQGYTTPRFGITETYIKVKDAQ